MRKLIVLSFISLDGVMQSPGGPQEDTSGGFRYGGWTFPFFDNALGKIMGVQMSEKADLLLGRKTYDIFASYWPLHGEDWPNVNKTTKYVASTLPLKINWENSVRLEGDLVKEVKNLKLQDGNPLHVYGSSDMIQTLLKNDLVDELWLKIFPITLGNGKRLFGKGTIPASFRLLNGEISPNGVIIASYARDGDVKTGTFE